MVHIYLANGSDSPVRPCGIPLVSSVAAAIFDVGLDASDDGMDCQHHARLRNVALCVRLDDRGGRFLAG